MKKHEFHNKVKEIGKDLRDHGVVYCKIYSRFSNKRIKVWGIMKDFDVAKAVLSSYSSKVVPTVGWHHIQGLRIYLED
ncbi:MAG: hypothetical protein SVK08_02935 [Halobacteriota archaeon]|nr:hypothetical protein [Halobacteriota archaeon]